MPLRVKVVNQELRLGEKFGFSSHAVWTKCASKVVNDSFWCCFPTGDQGRKNIISTFSFWNTVEPIANTMCTPDAHNSASQSSFPILGIKFRAFGSSFAANFIIYVVLQLRVPRSFPNLWKSV